MFTEQELLEQVAKLDGWKLKDGRLLVRKYSFNEFMKGIAFVGEVAAISEAFDHHPRITIDYKTVTLELTTKEEEGVTSLDIRQAYGLNEAYERTR